MLIVSYKGNGFFLVRYGLALKNHGVRPNNVTATLFISIKFFVTF